jgi:hypothetical protein
MFEHEKTITVTKDDAPWAPKEELGEWIVQRWKWLAKQQALEASYIIIDKEKGKVELDSARYYQNMMLKCVVKYPEGFEPTLARFANLDHQVGTLLIRALREVNGLAWEEKRLFLEQSDSKNDIPG